MAIVSSISNPFSRVSVSRIGVIPASRAELRDLAIASESIPTSPRIGEDRTVATSVLREPLPYTAEPVEEARKIDQLVDWYKRTDEQLVTGLADTFNVTPKTVETVGLLSLVGTGAGLLANGVKSLFDGTLKAKRLERKAERQERRAVKKAAPITAALSSYLPAGQGQVAGGGPLPGSGVPLTMESAGMYAKKYWWAIVGVLLLIFWKKLFKPKRRPPRKRQAPKVITRYRTRKPATRKRR